MKEYFRLLRFVKPYLGLFGLGSLFMALSALFDGVSMSMMVPVADKMLTNKNIVVPAKLPGFLADLVALINSVSPLVLLNYLSFIVLILFFLKGVIGFLQGYIMSDIGQRVVTDIRLRLFEKFQSLSLDYFTHKRGGELMSRIVNDVRLVENAVSYGVTDVIYQGLQVVIFSWIIFSLYAKLALISLVLMPLISWPIIKVGKVLRKLSKRGQERMADINSHLYESILGVRVIKAFTMENYEAGRFGAINRDYYKVSMKSIKRVLLVSPITEFLGCIAGVVVFYIGSKDVIEGRMSFGVFVLFFGALMSLIRPFKKLSQVNSIIQQALAASTRIHEVLDTKPTVVQRANAVAVPVLQKQIVFDSVWFQYQPGMPVLKDVQLKIARGEVLAIVGPSGSGKTTLVDLIPRFYDPHKGSVTIDGRDIREVTVHSLRSQIGIVTQETILFNDTIRANIAYGRSDISQEALEEAATQAHAHEFISRLASGYDTVIGDRGMRLSGGERQRLAIARAFLKNPPILILDEATSQLDTESERMVQDALAVLMKGRTVFIIAHRLSTIRTADRIVVLEAGSIVEQGTHEQLLKKKGLYERLYQNQSV